MEKICSAANFSFFHTVPHSQCRNLRIFLQIRFYVKSIVESQKFTQIFNYKFFPSEVMALCDYVAHCRKIKSLLSPPPTKYFVKSTRLISSSKTLLSRNFCQQCVNFLHCCMCAYVMP